MVLVDGATNTTYLIVPRPAHDRSPRSRYGRNYRHMRLVNVRLRITGAVAVLLGSLSKTLIGTVTVMSRQGVSLITRPSTFIPLLKYLLKSTKNFGNMKDS